VAGTELFIDVDPNACNLDVFIATAPAGSCANPFYAAPFTLPAGAHTLSYYSFDGADNVEGLNQVAVTVSAPIPPTLTLTPASGSALDTASPAIIATYAAGAAALSTATFRLSLDGVDVTTQAVVTASSASFSPGTPLAGGTHTVAAAVADVLGDTAAATSTFLVDTTPPVTSLSIDSTTVAAGAYSIASTDTLSLAATDAGSGVANTFYVVDADPFSPACSAVPLSTGAPSGTCANEAYNGPFTLTGGTHTVYYFSEDYAGNQEAENISSFTVTSPFAPTLASLAVTPSSSTLAAGASVQFTAVGTFTDGSTQAVTTAWSIDAPSVATITATGLATGLSSGTAHVTASSGAVSGLATLTVFPSDATPPVTTISFSTPSFVSAGTVVAVATRSSVALSAVDLSSGGVTASGVAATYYSVDVPTRPATVYVAPFTLSTGTHTVYFNSVDVAGNVEAISSATVAVYAGPFAGTVVPSSGPIGVSVALAGFNFGAYGGAAKSQLLFGASTAPISVWNDAAITAAVPGLSTGVYTLSVVSLQNGATAAVAIGSFTVLTPTIIAVVPSSGPIGLAFTLSGSAFGAYAGANTQVLLGGATVPISVWNDATITGLIPGALSPGAYSVQVERKASGGGLVLSNSVPFSVVPLDLTSATPSTGPIGITYSLTGSGFGTYAGGNTQVLIGGTSSSISVWNDANIQGTVPALSAGAYSLVVERLQGTGVAFSGVATFTVTALSFAGPTPASGPIGVSFTLSGSGFGPYAGTNTRLLLGGATVAVSVWNDASITGAVPAVSTGAQAVWIERRSGNGVESSATSYFTVTSLSFTGPTPSSGPIGVSFTLNGSGFGPYAGANTRLLLAGATVAVSVWNDTSITGVVPAVSTGPQPVWIERESGIGVESSATSYFNVVTPVVTGVSPSSGPIGVVYTLSGSGFGTYNGSNTLLLIGGTTTSISVWNNTQIQGVVPALSTGSYPVTVEQISGSGRDVSTVATFTVTALSFTGPSPASGPVATSITLSGPGFGAYNGSTTRALFAGTTMAISVWNDATITASVPTAAPGPQAVWIERQSGNGVESSATNYFTVVAPAVASVLPSSGPIGISITLSGSGFGTYNGSNTLLLLAGATCPISVWNNTTITATVPGALSASTGAVSVVVERIASGGISFSTAATFLVLSPSVASLTPSTGPIGIAFTLTGAAFGTYNGSNTQVLIGGATAPISVWNNATITGTVPALASGTYALSVELLQGGYTEFSNPSSFTVAASMVASMTPSSAPIGAPFTISGVSFGTYNGSNTTVKFNGVAAPISVWNDSTITGSVPGAVSSGPANVLVTRLVGAAAATVTAPPFTVLVPTISNIAPSFGPAGTAVTLTGFGFGPYAGASGSQLLVNGSTMAVAVWNDSAIRWTVPSSLANGTYPVLVSRTPSGGSVTSNSASFTVGTSMGVGALFASAPAPLSAQPSVNFVGDMVLPAVQGGLILTPSQAAVNIPAGALSADTEVTLARDKTSDASSRAAGLGVAALASAGEPIAFGPEGTQFSAPVTITLPYDPTLVPTGALTSLAIQYYDPIAKSWTALTSSVDSVNHVVSAQTNHFSLYQPLIPAGLGAASAAQDAFGLRAYYVFPNPTRGTRQATIRIQPGLADSVEVHVYDLTGRNVHSSSDFRFTSSFDDLNGLGPQDTFDHVWDVSGVGSGVYTYVITARKAGQADIHATGKIGVVK
jgi:hypothetical protein